jgi:hypothetical protein
MGLRRIAKANDIWKGVATGIASASADAPDYLVCEITSVDFRWHTFGHAIGLRSSASVSKRSPQGVRAGWLQVPIDRPDRRQTDIGTERVDHAHQFFVRDFT